MWENLEEDEKKYDITLQYMNEEKIGKQSKKKSKIILTVGKKLSKWRREERSQDTVYCRRDSEKILTVEMRK